jgi:hypothetical protein
MRGTCSYIDPYVCVFLIDVPVSNAFQDTLGLFKNPREFSLED